MKITNYSRKSVIATDALICRSFISKALGLMFRRSVKRSLLFTFSRERKVSLHMMFVFCPIDVIWISKDKKVVQLKEAMRPFSAVRGRRPAMYVLELPCGEIARSGTAIGDRIMIVQERLGRD